VSRQTRHNWWSASNRHRRSSRKHRLGSFQRRSLRFEPLEDRRLLAVVTVDTLDDSVNLGDGHTSLREAIFATNTVPGPDTINFAPALTASGPATILLTQGELAITDALTINGPSANLLTIDASGSDPTPGVKDGLGGRIFNIDSDHPFLPAPDATQLLSVTINGLALTGGESGDVYYGGGAIFSRENLTISGCDIHDNSALARGGGIFAQEGILSIDDSVVRDNSVTKNGIGDGGGITCEHEVVDIADSLISGNSATSFGGGLYFEACDITVRQSEISGNDGTNFAGGISSTQGKLTIIDTTIIGNTAGHGAGIYSEYVGSGGLTTISGCAISDNVASGRGGALDVRHGHVVIGYTTITGNEAPDGQGSGIAARFTDALVEITSSILAGNGSSDVDSLDSATFISHGFNLVGTGLAEDAFNQPGDQAGVLDPKLNPLADNGGFLLPDGSHILTHALMPGSPALDAGDPAAVADVDGVPQFDQRGTPFTRVYDIDGSGGPRIDIGAYEAQPFTLVVDTLADESDGDYSAGDFSLREAIEFANSHAGHDTIVFSGTLTELGPASIVLSLGELQITDALTIRGPGTDRLTIDASGNDLDKNTFGNGSRIFNIDDHSIQVIQVQIRDLTLTGGDAIGNGGAIFSAEQLLVSGLLLTGNHTTAGGGAISTGASQSPANVITNCTITNNVAGGTGGGILVQGSSTATVLISGNTISGNTARAGGAIYAGRSAPGFVTISDDTISGNTATQQGGAIYLALSNTVKATISQSMISGNTAAQQGGALFISSARDLSITGSTIVNNSSTSASPSLSRGGGIYLNATDISISGSTISGNSAAAGGGVYSANGELTVNFSTIQNNNASNGNGGGIFSRLDRLTVTGSTISGNTANGPGASAGGDGGGLWHSTGTIGPSQILDTIISGNSVNQNGGGLYASSGIDAGVGSNLTLVNVTIDGNSAARGAGLTSTMGGQITSGRLALTDGSISGNTATLNGGGVYSRYASLALDGTTISGNRAGGNGGGVAVAQSSNQATLLSLFNAAVTTNVAGPNGDGGGLWIPTGNAQISLVSSKIDGNSARRGGGIFRGTSAIQGGIAAIDSSLSGNTATQSGGGIYNQGGALAFTRSTISGNTANTQATGGGGGVFARQTDVTLISTSLIGNSNMFARGGGLYLNSGDLNVTGTTIAANFARQGGGGVQIQSGPNDRVVFQSSTVSGNSSGSGTGGISVTGGLTLRNSTITKNVGAALESGNGGVGGIDFNPVNTTLESDHTIIAGNIGSIAPDLRFQSLSLATIRSTLIGDNTGSPLLEAPLGSPDINGNIIGEPTSKGGSGVIDARLGPLASNGGPTQTHALLPGSPAIDAGAIISGPPLGYDQRGVPFSRAVDGNGDSIVRIDIGAYESQGIPSFSPGDYNQNGIVDTADYTIWRDSLHREVVPFSGADGDGSGRVDTGDFAIWSANFGHLLFITPPATGGSGAASLEFRVDAPSETAPPKFGASLFSEGVLSATINRQSDSAGQPVAAPAINDSALLAWLTPQSNVRFVPNESASLANQARDEFEPPGRDFTSLEAAFESIGDGFETPGALAL
jgi:CSLREA domain-containing protein